MNIKVPVSWLRDYLKTDLATKTIASYLTASGPSVERITRKGEDFILDVEVTTNRPDTYSVFGLSRETQAILENNNQKSALISPKGLSLNLEPDRTNPLQLDVLIRDKSLCQRFTAIIIDKVKIKPSPAFIRNRLTACGIRPINNIVDISNYIMMELGQPMHTFDFDKIRGAKMIMRESKEGERIKTLDGQTRKLKKGTIVIADNERLIDLCGIMGGENSQITRRTKRVLLFVQSYDPIRIRKTTQALAFRTEAASRFEKGIDLEEIVPALSRAVYLAKLTAGAKIASELVDIYPQKIQAKSINLDLDKLNSYLGINFPLPKATRILQSLGFKTKISNHSLTSAVPSWRTNDMEEPEDLIEEIARIYGYHNLPSKLPSGQISQSEESILGKVIKLKEALKFMGLTEVISYSIISKDLLTLTGVDAKSAVELTNPLTDQWQFMRPILLVSLAQIIGQNQHLLTHHSPKQGRRGEGGKSNLKLFEVAKTYLPAEAKAKAGEKATNLPIQDLKLSIVLSGAHFYEIKGYLENIFAVLARDFKLQKLTHNDPIFEQTQCAKVKLGDTIVGTIGMLKQSLLDYFQIASPAAACEINLSTIYDLPSTIPIYHPIPKYSPVIEDISAIFDEKVLFADIVAEVRRAGEPLVKNIELIDIFQDPKLGKNKKSITLRLTYQKSNETPSQEEVTRFRNIIIREITRIFKALIRK